MKHKFKERIMKKIFLALITIFASVQLANAQFTNNQNAGGFNGPRAPSMKTITVQQALDMSDDSIVVLEGKIANSLGDEKYLFKDNTGEVIIEIDDEDWHGVNVTPDTTLEIVGELDKEFMEKTKIDVKSFTVK